MEKEAFGEQGTAWTKMSAAVATSRASHALWGQEVRGPCREGGRVKDRFNCCPGPKEQLLWVSLLPVSLTPLPCSAFGRSWPALNW